MRYPVAPRQHAGREDSPPDLCRVEGRHGILPPLGDIGQELAPSLEPFKDSLRFYKSQPLTRCQYGWKGSNLRLSV